MLIFGVPRNNPYITPPDKSRYDCCIEITGEDIERLDHEALYNFKGGKHVVYEFDVPVEYSDRGKLIECYSEL